MRINKRGLKGMARNKTVLSNRQLDMLRYIYTHTVQRGYCPTIRELGDVLGIKSTSGVKYQLERLEQKSCILRSSRTSRAITLTEKAYMLLDASAKIKEIPSISEDLLQEVRRLRQENARLRRIVDQGNAENLLQVQKEHLEHKHRCEIEKLEQDRDRLIDQLVRLQMSIPSQSGVRD